MTTSDRGGKANLRASEARLHHWLNSGDVALAWAAREALDARAVIRELIDANPTSIAPYVRSVCETFGVDLHLPAVKLPAEAPDDHQ